MPKEISDLLHAMRRATTRLEFALMGKQGETEYKPDLQEINDAATVIYWRLDQILNEIEGTI